MKMLFGGPWVAESVKPLTLGFGSGHSLMVHEFEPCIRLSAVSVEPALDPLYPSVCPSLTYAQTLFLKNKLFFFISSKTKNNLNSELHYYLSFVLLIILCL